MDYRTRTALLQEVSDRFKKQLSEKVGEHGPDSDFLDLNQMDEADNENYLKQRLTGEFLDHTLFKIISLIGTIGNLVTITFKADPQNSVKDSPAVQILDDIVHTIFLWEIILKWFYGFRVYWKNGWNIVEFICTACVLLATRLAPVRAAKIIIIFRVLRSIRGFAIFKGISMINHVISQSLVDVAYSLLLLGLVMLVFGVVGIGLFRHSSKGFDSLTETMYSLFILITQDGWMPMYEVFEENSDVVMLYAVRLFFTIFIICAGFVLVNHPITVVLANLELAMTSTYKTEAAENTDSPQVKPSDPKDALLEEQKNIDLKKVVAEAKATMLHTPDDSSCLGNLTVTSFEELVFFMAAMIKNQEEYQEIRRELRTIIEEVLRLPFNKKKEQELIKRNLSAASIQKQLLSDDLRAGRTGDILSTLMSLEKAHMIEINPDSGQLFTRGMIQHQLKHMSSISDIQKVGEE